MDQSFSDSFPTNRQKLQHHLHIHLFIQFLLEWYNPKIASKKRFGSVHTAQETLLKKLSSINIFFQYFQYKLSYTWKRWFYNECFVMFAQRTDAFNGIWSSFFWHKFFEIHVLLTIFDWIIFHKFRIYVFV